MLAILAASRCQPRLCPAEQRPARRTQWLPPDAGKGASSAREPAGNPYLSSLDPQGERFQRDLERAEAARKAAASVKSQTYSAEDGNPQGSPWTASLWERIGLAVLAGMGLLVSLAAVGYVHGGPGPRLCGPRAWLYPASSKLGTRPPDPGGGRESSRNPQAAAPRDLPLCSTTFLQRIFPEARHELFLKQLNRLSVDDLQKLQMAIKSGEIPCRRDEAGTGSHGPLAAIVGRIQWPRTELSSPAAASTPARAPRGLRGPFSRDNVTFPRRKP